MDLQGIVGVVATDVMRGLFMAFLYLQMTVADDTTVENLAYIAFFYTAMTTSARILGYSENVVVNAFITKMIFTVVDEQIRAKKVEKNNTK